eukprot:15484979-Alexandrium_andersonii.AAC.1
MAQSSTAPLGNSMTRTEGGHLAVHDRSPGSLPVRGQPSPAPLAEPSWRERWEGKSIPRETPRAQALP